MTRLHILVYGSGFGLIQVCTLLRCYRGTTHIVVSCTRYYDRNGMLNVRTSLSDSRQETVEKIMERRISWVSYMCWIDFHNGNWGCGFLCARLISFLFVACLYFGYHAEGYHAPSIPHGPPRLYHHCTAITPVYIPATTPRATTPHLYHHVLSHPS